MSMLFLCFNADVTILFVNCNIYLPHHALCWCIQILAVFACACIIYIHLTVYGIDIVHMSILHLQVCVITYTCTHLLD